MIIRFEHPDVRGGWIEYKSESEFLMVRDDLDSWKPSVFNSLSEAINVTKRRGWIGVKLPTNHIKPILDFVEVARVLDSQSTWENKKCEHDVPVLIWCNQCYSSKYDSLMNSNYTQGCSDNFPKCECGGAKAKTTHSTWCPARQ
jgi:hypothetical protein